MRWMPRFRMLLARRPWIYWSAVTALAAAASLIVAASLDQVHRERDSWGDTVEVFVATAAIGPGQAVEPMATSAQFPIAMVPAGAVRSLSSGTVARQRISAGEIVVEVDVSAVRGVLALLPARWLAITIEGNVQDGYTPGDSAAVFAAGRAVAPRAIIVRVLTDAVVVGVPADVAAAVTDVVNQGLAVIAVGGG